MQGVNKERVELLAVALESGEFEQCTKKLCAVDSNGNRKFCCLGVATVVAIRNGLKLDEHLVVVVAVNGSGYSGYISWDGETGILPLRVKEWYGFDQADPRLDVENDVCSSSCLCGTCTGVTATSLNDARRWDFIQIAQAFRDTFLTESEAAGEAT